jgi:hypothetical protein
VAACGVEEGVAGVGVEVGFAGEVVLLCCQNQPIVTGGTDSFRCFKMVAYGCLLSNCTRSAIEVPMRKRTVAGENRRVE